MFESSTSVAFVCVFSGFSSSRTLFWDLRLLQLFCVSPAAFHPPGPYPGLRVSCGFLVPITWLSLLPDPFPGSATWAACFGLYSGICEFPRFFAPNFRLSILPEPMLGSEIFAAILPLYIGLPSSRYLFWYLRTCEDVGFTLYTSGNTWTSTAIFARPLPTLNCQLPTSAFQRVGVGSWDVGFKFQVPTSRT